MDQNTTPESPISSAAVKTTKFVLGADEEIIEETFVVREKSSGLFTAYKLDGTPMSTGLTRKAAAFATSHYLKAEQDGTLWENSTTIESAKMGVKL